MPAINAMLTADGRSVSPRVSERQALPPSVQWQLGDLDILLGSLSAH